MSVVSEQAKHLLACVLGLSDGGAGLTDDSLLLGAIPEFDSMAVVSVITAVEERFGFVVDDDEIDASVFESVGSLVAFIERKRA